MTDVVFAFLKHAFGPYSQYVLLPILATIAFFYLAAQVFSLRRMSGERMGKKVEAVKLLLEATKEHEDLLAEEAFVFSYGFPLSADEIEYIAARRNQRALILDIKAARYLLSFVSTPQRGYEYKKRFTLKTRRIALNSVYWVSSVMAYLTFMLAIGTNEYPLLIFVFIFTCTVYASLEQLKAISASSRILGGKTFPLKAQELTVRSTGHSPAAQVHAG